MAQRNKRSGRKARGAAARRVRDVSRERVQNARDQMSRALETRRKNSRRKKEAQRLEGLPYLALVHTPRRPISPRLMGSRLKLASYNVHRWTGLNGRKAPDPARAGFVISELDADVIALQEVLRPEGEECPLSAIADVLGMHLTFAVTRQHRRGQLGNAILSRFPMTAISVIDISFSRVERRGALAVQFGGEAGNLAVIATHLSLVDRTRQRQVKQLLRHPQLQSGPAVLLGDMNAWRKCKATQELNDQMDRHHNRDWPSTFPATAPVLALDRVYAHRAKVLSVRAHDTPSSRRASDHLPVVARIELPAPTEEPDER